MVYVYSNSKCKKTIVGKSPTACPGWPPSKSPRGGGTCTLPPSHDPRLFGTPPPLRISSGMKVEVYVLAVATADAKDVKFLMFLFVGPLHAVANETP